MKPTAIILTALILFTMLTGCDSYKQERGNGNIMEQERAVDNFSKVQVSGNFEVYLKKSDSPGLIITTDENLHEFIEVKQKGDVLEVKSDRTLKSREGVKLLIEFTELTAISSSGASVIESEDVITGDYLRLEMSGAGAIDLSVDLKALKVNVSGAGAVELRGNVTEQNIQMSGAGGLDAKRLVSKKCKIEISGVGGASLNVKEALDASVSGVGGITYRGNPAQVKTNISGLGTITREEDAAEDEEV
ncbi:hypothetical protein C900_02737 [Fulvivirga imtechensis AK7]|uniref:Putative auto-transporter adhesin head GIN domain-containing protein n=1 Tax=Fulvivirga imtechensis AK7 TaxID=1237149 RepID=L8JQZ4_9BACT|nr:head GIN domain-containing protein [Fulvivirga imtechensis]ELR71396.1 hypothetical protein C900_02737 [Fulvivirga imtechensis AK7]